MLQRLFGWLSRLISRPSSRPTSDDTSDTPSSPPDWSPGLSDSESWIPTWITPQEFLTATGLRTVEYYEHFKNACLAYYIDTPVRISAFLAQTGHESRGFTRFREIWGPTPAQLRYEGRADLGNVQPGDGSRFRGRGAIQITGRANYELLEDELGYPVTRQPELLEQMPLAILSAAWWWHRHGCNELADSRNFEALTRRINGGLNGLEDRKLRWERAKKAIGG